MPAPLPHAPRPLLDVRGLTIALEADRRRPAGPTPLVTDVSFTIDPAETLGLVGESGSGKSLTALALLRLVPPPCRIVSGEVYFEGRNLLALAEPELGPMRGGRIGFVFQDPSSALNPVFSIGDQLMETIRIHQPTVGRAGVRQTAVALLDEVRVPDAVARMGDYPHQLSGGLRQRVMIALALAGRPSLLIADEPTTALDVTIQAQILDLLRELRERLGLAILLITHDLGVLASMAHRVAVMQAGRLVETAGVDDLFARPSHPYTRALLESVRFAASPVLGSAAGGRSSVQEVR